MAATSRKAAPATSAVAPRRVLEMMKEATGASDEDICVMLQLCGGDANEATTKLLESECFLSASGSACWAACGACHTQDRAGCVCSSSSSSSSKSCCTQCAQQ